MPPFQPPFCFLFLPPRLPSSLLLPILDSGVALRGRVNTTKAFALANRGENRRATHLPYIGTVSAPPIDRGATPYQVLLILYPQTKTRKNIEITGCLRNEDVDMCFVSNTGMYLLYRLDIMVRREGGREGEA